MGSCEEISSTLKSSSLLSAPFLTINQIQWRRITSLLTGSHFLLLLGLVYSNQRYKAPTMLEKFKGLLVNQNNGTDEELEKMRSKADLLFAKAGDITGEVKKAELNGCKRKREVENWLQKVENVSEKKQCIEDQVRGKASSSRTVPNIQVAEITKEIDELLQHSLPRELTFSGDALTNVPFVTGSLKGHLFEENRQLILSLLDDDDVATIGIYGAGGIGKTTLVTHVQKRLCEKFNNERGSRNVYFVTVSHGLTISGLQFKIANQLGLKIEGEDVMKAAAMIYGAFTRREYSVLILDDLWESFRPSEVGLPVGEGGFKLLLTTRNKRVCLEINNEKSWIIEVTCLSDDESWDLFREKLGDSAILSQAGDIARKVAKECRGLPLALEHIAISMRAADTVEEWRTVLADMSEMRLNVVEDKVLPLLGYSYDRLRDQQLKDCFLYCSFFPEDHWIRRTELIDIWIREGLLDGVENREHQRDKGVKFFKELINLSLLKADDNEYRSAKMHDLVREMAIKVGKEKGFLIRAGEKMRDIPGEREWNEDLWKVSLMNNDIGSISPDAAPRCPNLSSLLLSCNESLTSISSLFFSLMDGLCVLDLSGTGIEKLPYSVSNLKNLTALLLNDCHRLNYVPSVSMLGKLREMDIGYCGELRDLPHGMEGLVNLKFLDSFECPAPVSRILSGLSHLEELTLSDSSVAKGQDLMKLMHLKRLRCWIRNVSEFNEYVMSQCFASLHQYWLNVGPVRYVYGDGILPFMRSVQFEECRFEEDSLIVPGNVEYLGLFQCSGVEYLVSSASPDSTLGDLVELYLDGLENFKGLVKPGVALPPGSLSNLKTINIVGCDGIKKLFTWSMVRGNLQNLERLEIWECDGIKKLFTWSMVRGNLQNLEEIEISDCPHLEEVIGGSYAVQNDNDFTRVDHSNLLESLRPHNDSKKVSIKYFNGRRFPDWAVDRSYNNIEVVELSHCRLSSGSMPLLGQMPSLKILSICDIANMKILGIAFYDCKDPFRSLEKLFFEDMTDWEEWEQSDDDVAGGICFFPRLQNLRLVNCPSLNGRLPAQLPSLTELFIDGCSNLVTSCLDDERFFMFSSLQRLVLAGCDSVERFPAEGSLPPSLTSFQIMRFMELNRLDLQNLTSLESLNIYHCPKLEALSVETLTRTLKDLHLYENHPNLVEQCQRDYSSLCNIKTD